MAGDRTAEFVISLGTDSTDIVSALAALKGQFRSAVAEMQAQSDKLDLFGQLTSNLPKVQQAIDRNTAAIAGFRKEIEKVQAAGGVVSDDLTKGLAAAEKAAASARAEFAKQTNQISALQAGFKAAGIDSSNLAAAQAKLAAATRAAADASAIQQSKQAIGLRTLADIKPEIDKLNVAYNTLAASGKLSMAELAVAHKLVQDRVEQLRGSVSGLEQQTKGASLSMGEAWQLVSVKLLAIVATVTTVAATFKTITDAGKDYENAIARLGVVSNATAAEQRALGEAARQLALRVGVDLKQTLEGMYELLRSGTPPENVITVLDRAAIAAKASLTDMSTAVKVADALMDSFGANLQQLGGYLDMVVVGAKNGGATLDEWATNGAKLLAVAQATNVPLSELIATLDVMARGSGDAAGSMDALAKIMVQLQSAEVRDKLHGLGIETSSLTGIFQALQATQLGVDEVLALGVGSARAAGGVAALTQNAKDLAPELDKVATSAGTAQRNIDAMANSPAFRDAKFKAEIKDLETAFGDAFGSGSRLASVGTSILSTLRQLDEAIAQSNAAQDPDNIWNKWAAALTGVDLEAGRAAFNLQKMGAAATDAAGQTVPAAALAQKAAADLSKANTDLAGAAARLLAGAQELAKVGNDAMALLTKAADDAIAALDRGPTKAADTARQTLAIQTKLAADQLALLKDTEKKVTAAQEDAIEGRRRALVAEGKSEAAIALETARLRASYLGPLLNNYQAHYDRILGLNQQYQSAVRTSEEGRLAFNTSVEDRIFQVRLAALSSFDQYVAKSKEADRLVSLSREAAAIGDVKKAEEYGNKAIAVADTMGKAYSTNGAEIVSATDAAARRATVLATVQQSVNEAYRNQGAAAKEGAAETERELNRVKPILEQMRDLVAEANKALSSGIKLGVALDTESLRVARDALDALTQPRTVTVTVNTVQGNNGGGFIRAFAGGGTVGQAIQRFAGGGSVFRRPSWDKVPGSGNADTQPALLQEGSFVVRKAASAAAGDSFMSRLVRFALGGPVAYTSTGSYQGDKPKPNGSNSSDVSYFSDVPRGTTRQVGDTFGPPTLPSDPKALERVARQYASDVSLAAIQVDGLSFWRNMLDFLAKELRTYNRNPTPQNLQNVIGPARDIGLNIGITRNRHDGFDIDGRRWHDAGPANSGGVNGLAGLGRMWEFYAGGGSVGTDTVPAMLTPGEWVLKPKAVQRIARLFGGGFLPALNAMRLPPGMLDGLSNFAPPRPLAFANGGPVPGGPAVSVSGSSGGPAPVMNVYVQRLTENELNTVVKPWLNKLNTRSR